MATAIRVTVFIIVFTTGFLTIALARQKVSVAQTDQTVTLWNDAIEVVFNKVSSNITYLKKGSSNNLLGPKGRGYLNGPSVTMSPSVFKLVRQQPDLVEISFYHEGENHLNYELHYVLTSGLSGIYCFLLVSHQPDAPDADYGQTRWGISADAGIFDYHLVRDNHQGPMPLINDLKDAVQDWTYRFPDSTYYTKYDYADYIEDKYVHGMAGTKSGYGLFVIQASHEYLLGGPTKQFQNVHAGPFLICMFQDGHFLWDGRPNDHIIKGDWKKLSGPFLLYANQGNDIKAVWADAKSQALKEKAQWPYNWMKNTEYPLERGTVNGSLLLNNGAKASAAHVILAAPGIDWQAQSSGYIFYTQTDVDGNFGIKLKSWGVVWEKNIFVKKRQSNQRTINCFRHYSQSN